MPICPSQLTAPNLHKILECKALRPHIWGAKGVGSQGDGCAQLLCRSVADMERVTAIVEREFKMSCMCVASHDLPWSRLASRSSLRRGAGRCRSGRPSR